MSLHIGPMIGAASKIAEYFGLIEGVNTNVTKLLHQAFNSAKANLEYARNATGQNQIDYIKQARVEFNQAVAVEENENKILALVGLAMCQYLLGETFNANVTFEKICSVSLTRAEKNRYLARKNATRIIFLPAVTIADLIIGNPIKRNPTPILDFSLSERKACFEALKKETLNKRNKFLQ